jgi:hypothetical protein
MIQANTLIVFMLLAALLWINACLLTEGFDADRTVPIDCQFTAGPWGPCTIDCLTQKSTQSRSVTVQKRAQNGGKKCPPAIQRKSCKKPTNRNSCGTGTGPVTLDGLTGSVIRAFEALPTFMGGRALLDKSQRGNFVKDKLLPYKGGYPMSMIQVFAGKTYALDQRFLSAVDSTYVFAGHAVMLFTEVLKMQPLDKTYKLHIVLAGTGQLSLSDPVYEGYGGGGGVVVKAETMLRNATDFQKFVAHEMGHSFGVGGNRVGAGEAFADMFSSIAIYANSKYTAATMNTFSTDDYKLDGGLAFYSVFRNTKTPIDGGMMMAASGSSIPDYAASDSILPRIHGYGRYQNAWHILYYICKKLGYKALAVLDNKMQNGAVVRKVVGPLDESKPFQPSIGAALVPRATSNISNVKYEEGFLGVLREMLRPYSVADFMAEYVADCVRGTFFSESFVWSKGYCTYLYNNEKSESLQWLSYVVVNWENVNKRVVEVTVDKHPEVWRVIVFHGGVEEVAVQWYKVKKMVIKKHTVHKFTEGSRLTIDLEGGGGGGVAYVAVLAGDRPDGRTTHVGKYSISAS